MTGICGWLGHTQQQHADSLIDRMTANLPPGSGMGDNHSVGQIAGRLSGRFQAQLPEAGIAVVLDGAPRWADQNLAACAVEHGHAQALLKAYLDSSARFLELIGGSFALAILNEKSGELLLAVDRLGQRPLCYTRTPGNEVVFGSTTNSVLEYAGVTAKLSSQAIYDYMYFHVVPSPATIYTDILKLEPGEMLRCDHNGIRKEYYWSPSFNTPDNTGAQHLQEELLEKLRQSIDLCQPDQTTGCFLSGGLDSSTVAGLANETTESPMRAYSIGFDQQGYDEMEFARIAANHFGLELRDYYVTPEDVAEAMGLIATAYDEPFGNSSAIPAYFCAKQAREEGISRLLAGDGGDEIFGGNERYAKQQIFDRYELVPAWLRSMFIEPALFTLPVDWNPITRKARRYIEQARVPMPERLQTYNYLHLNSPSEIFDNGFLGEVDTNAPIASMESWYDRSSDADLLNKMLHFDWKLTLADNDLRKVNRMCEIAGVQVDYPLLDDELIAMSTRTPSKLKMKNNQLRSFYKSALAEVLPTQILTKEKHGFGLPFGEWLKTSIPLQNAVLPHLELLKDRRIFKAGFIDKLIHQHQTEHAAYYGNIIWVLTMLEMWLQAHAA